MKTKLISFFNQIKKQSPDERALMLARISFALVVTAWIFTITKFFLTR